MTTTTASPAAACSASRAWRVERDERRGLVFVRAAGVADPAPAGWRDVFAGAMEAIPGAVALGAKRLTSDGRIFSMGEMVVHPKGFHHLMHGLSDEAGRFPEEVDAICGGVLAVAIHAFDPAAGPALLARTGGAELALIELCLELRRQGGRVITLPHVTVIDEHSPAPAAAELAGFRQRLGFDCLAADLEPVRRRYRGTGLLWNLRVHAEPLPFEKYQRRRLLHWTSYREVDVYRQRADHLVELAARIAGPGLLLDLGCGDGLYSHLLGRRGIAVVGVDPEAEAIDQASEACAAADVAAPPPAGAIAPDFHVGSGEALPFDDGHFASIIALDVIEHLPNPVAVLRECRRVLAPGGKLMISTPAWQHGAWSDPCYHVCEYTLEELIGQIHAATDLRVTTHGRIGGVYRDLVVVAGPPEAGAATPDRR